MAAEPMIAAIAPPATADSLLGSEALPAGACFGAGRPLAMSLVGGKWECKRQ